MGGMGSGGANRKRPHFEGLRRIDAGYLVRHRMDRPGTYSTHSWRDNWQRPTGSMQVVGGDDVVTLVYSVRNGDAEDWRQIEERVTLTRVAKPFGGAQTYFRCPRCSRMYRFIDMFQPISGTLKISALDTHLKSLNSRNSTAGRGSYPAAVMAWVNRRENSWRSSLMPRQVNGARHHRFTTNVN